MNILYDMLDHGGEGNEPSKIVIHSMGEFIAENGDVYSARNYLDKLGWSVHYFIKPSGDIIQCRANNQTAWHAAGHNENSIGIEFLVEGQHDYPSFLQSIEYNWCRKAQYDAGIELVRDLFAEFGDMMLVRHSDISPGRKLDPGNGFHWEWFKDHVKYTKN